MRPWRWFGWFLAAVVAALALTTGAVIGLHACLTQWELPVERLGVVGDMFGAATALFSGMAFAGLIIVLVYDMRERERDLSDRMESRRPVLTVQFGDGENDKDVTQAKIARAVPEPGRGVDLRLEVLIPLQSLSDVALKPALELAIVSHGSTVWSERRQIGLPINAGDSHELQFVAVLPGAGGRSLLSNLVASPAPRVRATVTYDSVSEVRWQTTVEAELRVAPEDDGFARQVLSESGVVDKNVPERIANSLKTDVNVDASTWKHGRLDVSTP